MYYYVYFVTALVLAVVLVRQCKLALLLLQSAGHLPPGSSKCPTSQRLHFYLEFPVSTFILSSPYPPSIFQCMSFCLGLPPLMQVNS